MKKRYLTLSGPIAIALYLFLYLPIVVVIVYSFNEARFGSVWQGFTTKWYGALWKNEVAMDALKNTFILAGISTALSTVMGTALGYGLSRYQFPGKRLFNGFLHVPVFIPDIVLAVSMLLFYSMARKHFQLFELGMPTMIMAHITFQIPFVAIVVRSRLANWDASLEEAASDLGCNPWQTFRQITLPLMMPGIMAGSILAFTLSLDDFVVSFFTSGAGSTTVPILVYSSVKRGITPEINALSTLVILASTITAIFIALLQRNRKYE